MRKAIQVTMLCVLMITVDVVYALPTAKLTVNVLDGTSAPVEAANVSVYFTLGVNQPNTKDGMTDEEGMFEVTGSTIKYVGSCYVTKDGYYPSVCNYSERNLKSISGIMGFRRWEPWNPTITVVLKKIKEPIALYMRDLGSVAAYNGVKDDPSSFLTEVNRFIGFDLIESDWVVPYGSGTRSDIEFKLEKDIRSIVDFDYQLTMRFPNDGDGIQSYLAAKDNTSVFKVPYHAPLENYRSALIRNLSSNYNKTDKERPDQNYFFRIRTEKDEEGNIVSALYGKIEGNIKIQAASKDNLGRMKFKYYLNPTPNDTNLEYDSEKNLFGTKFSKKR